MSITITAIRAGANAPAANFAEVHARDVLELAGLVSRGGYLCDSLDADAVPSALERVGRLLSDVPGQAARRSCVRETETTSRCVIAGTDDGAIRRRLHALRSVLAHAAQTGVGVCWG